MKYSDLKQQRDEAIARAVEAERLSNQTEVARIRAECEAEKEALRKERDMLAESLGLVLSAARLLQTEIVGGQFAALVSKLTAEWRLR